MLKNKPIVALILVLLATVVLAFVRIPFASLVFTVGSSIALIWLYVKTYAVIKIEDSAPGIIYILGITSIILIIVSYLFRMMHWPMYNLLYILGNILAVMIGVISVFTYVFSKERKRKTLSFLLILIPFVFVLLMGLFRVGIISSEGRVALVDKILLENSLIEHQLVNQLKMNNELFDRVGKSGSAIQTHQEAQKLYEHISGLKKKLIDDTGGREENGEYVGKMEKDKVIISLLGPEGARHGEIYKIDEELKALDLKYGNDTGFPYSEYHILCLDHFFRNQPTLAEALLTLSHIQLIVLQAEQQYLIKHVR